MAKEIFRVITSKERAEIDPRGLVRVTKLGDAILFPVVDRMDQVVPTSDVSSTEAEQSTIRTEGN